MIDWQRVITLREDVGIDGFAEVVDLFLEEVGAVIKRLNETPDRATLEADLHALRGSAQGMGFLAFAEVCQTGETQCAEGAAQNVDLDAILRSYAGSKRVFIQKIPKVLIG